MFGEEYFASIDRGEPHSLDRLGKTNLRYLRRFQARLRVRGLGANYAVHV
jgi:hypothetical protein